ncbi:recombinase family protein [Burkholderia territorii]|uniref:recombinase family protein n=1 Tax=Burkholderia territorii TaxID=1503055 RepID=UPI0039BFD5C6
MTTWTSLRTRQHSRAQPRAAGRRAQGGGCRKVLTEIASSATAERPVLTHRLDDARAGNVIVIWKLGRLGRPLYHLIDVVRLLLARDGGQRSLNDPVASPSRRLVTVSCARGLAQRSVAHLRRAAGRRCARIMRWRPAPSRSRRRSTGSGATC